MNDAPERIWAASEWKRIDQGKWWDCNPGGDATEYVISDRVQALVEAATRLADLWDKDAMDRIGPATRQVRAALRDMEGGER